MASLTKSLWRKLLIVLSFAAMIVANWMAVMGKINGIKTEAVSAKYDTMFTPEGYTFSIWGIIYLFLAIYVVFQLLTKALGNDGLHAKIASRFIVSSLVNAGWIVAWHYDLIFVSVILMVVLLICVTRMMTLASDASRSFGHLISLELPFGLYSGWITVATVANIAVLLVSLGWDGFGIDRYIWLIIVLFIAVFIAQSATRFTKNLGYPLAVAWGFVGILTRYLPDFRISVNEPAMWIVITLVICLLMLAIRWIDILARRLR